MPDFQGEVQDCIQLAISFDTRRWTENDKRLRCQSVTLDVHSCEKTLMLAILYQAFTDLSNAAGSFSLALER